MRWLALLLLVAPPAGADGVAIAWHDEATVPAPVRQRLTDGVAAQRGITADAIIERPVVLARQQVAVQIERSRIEALISHTRALKDAEAAYRSGSIDVADAGATEVINGLRQDPALPGAARLTWQATVLRARVAWTQGNITASEASLRAAIAIDPAGRLSTRRVPPALAELHTRLQAEMTAGKDAWSTPEVTLPPADDAGTEIEIDGRPGLRPVPPGEHFVVVRRAGSPAFAAVVDASAQLVVPSAETPIGHGFPGESETAQKLCDALSIDTVIVARVRDERVGLQGFACGKGFGDPWYGDAITEGAIRLALGLGAGGPSNRQRAAIGGDQPWPVFRAAVELEYPGIVRVEGGDKPWYKRVWIWTLVSGVVVGGVVTGAVLGTRDTQSDIRVDPDGFTE